MKFKKFSIFSAVATAGLALCVGLQQPAQAQTSAPTNPCSTVKTAAVGALLGAALGKFTHHNALKGAALGGAVGALACVTINYQSRRTQSAEQIRQTNPQTSNNAQAVVTQYQVQVNPANLPSGQEVSVTTSMDVLSGTQEPVQNLSVRYTLLDSNGNNQQTFTKSVDSVDAAGGGYQSTVSFTPPQGVPRGIYAVHADLLVNGVSRSSQNASYRII
jgi:hypothetical protein